MLKSAAYDRKIRVFLSFHLIFMILKHTNCCNSNNVCMRIAILERVKLTAIVIIVRPLNASFAALRNSFSVSLSRFDVASSSTKQTEPFRAIRARQNN